MSTKPSERVENCRPLVLMGPPYWAADNALSIRLPDLMHVPVSYTHLDVYKRQVQKLSLWELPLLHLTNFQWKKHFDLMCI